MNRNEILNTLREGSVDLTFTKADGSSRKMVATLSSDLIPSDALPKTDGNEGKKVNEEIVKCFDLEAKGWRSFRVDSLTRFANNDITKV